MMALAWLLLGLSACDEVSNMTFNSRNVPATSTTFRYCKFERCEDPLDGGALYVCDEFINLSIESCSFSQCRSLSGRGGGPYAFCLSFALAGTEASGCYAPQYNSFCYAVIDSTATGSLKVNTSSAYLCKGTRSTVHLACYTCTTGSVTHVNALNSSSNIADHYASGLYVAHHFSLSLQFSTFAHNGRANCLLFYDEILTTQISCVGLFNSSCHFSASYVGLLYIRANVTMENSFFHSNTFDLFVGGDATATFWRCVFDPEQLHITNFGNIMTSECAFASAGGLRADTNCPLPNATESASEAATLTNTASPLETTTPEESASFSVVATATLPAPVTATFSDDEWLDNETVAPAPAPEHKSRSRVAAIAGAVGGTAALIIIVIAIIAVVRRAGGGGRERSSLRQNFGRDPSPDVPPPPPDFDNMPPPQLI
jgi:hypothetical protein